MNGCKHFITECGLLGQTPADAQQGDVIAVFLGAPAPCILRRHGLFWLLIGGYCYLDGAMRGEVLSKVGVNKGIPNSQDSTQPLMDFCLW